MKDHAEKQLNLGGPLYQTTLDHLVAETGVSREELCEWDELGFLSFLPNRLAKYGDKHVVEVKFIASLVRAGLTRPMIHKMLMGLSRPYCLDPFKTCYCFATGEWHHAEGASVEALRRSIRDQMLGSELDAILTEAVRDCDLKRITEVYRRAGDAFARAGGKPGGQLRHRNG